MSLNRKSERIGTKEKTAEPDYSDPAASLRPASVAGLSEGNVRFHQTCQSTVSAVTGRSSMTRARRARGGIAPNSACFTRIVADQSGCLNHVDPKNRITSAVGRPWRSPA